MRDHLVDLQLLVVLPSLVAFPHLEDLPLEVQMVELPSLVPPPLVVLLALLVLLVDSQVLALPLVAYHQQEFALDLKEPLAQVVQALAPLGKQPLHPLVVFPHPSKKQPLQEALQQLQTLRLPQHLKSQLQQDPHQEYQPRWQQLPHPPQLHLQPQRLPMG